MPIKGIAHVQVSITAGGEDRARFFYGSILGMEEVPKPDSLSDRGGVWFACGEQQLHCGVEDIVSESRRHVALITDDLEGTQGCIGRSCVPGHCRPADSRVQTLLHVRPVW